MSASVLYNKICHKSGESFSYRHNSPFTMPLHSHDEYELIYIISGTGKEYIGDAVLDYEPGNLTLIGRNVPHLHLCNSYINNGNTNSSCHILQFPANVLPFNLSDIHEFYNIYLLLKDSMSGIRFNSEDTVFKVLRILKRFNSAQGVDRIVLLYKVLDILSKCTDRKIISSAGYPLQTVLHIDDPIEKIYAYIRSNYKSPVGLNDISSYIGQTPTSLCRLFKSRTGKTIFSVLNEIRIEHACRLLTVSNMSNAQIAYECGFNNLSYFNRVFKSVTGQTPTDYKNSLMYSSDYFKHK